VLPEARDVHDTTLRNLPAISNRERSPLHSSATLAAEVLMTPDAHRPGRVRAMSDLTWRLGRRHPGHDYGIFRTELVDAEHPRGGPSKQFSIIECADWVNIIALTRDDHVVLLRQFRPGTNQIYLEIPGGMIDPGEAPRAAAERELAEETGYASAHWELLGKVAPNPAIQTNHLHTFLARGASLVAKPAPDAGEVLEVETRTLAEVRDALVAGQIDHALVVTAFAHLAFRPELPWPR
jgi:8-oxo-dGTP pyrophosphatase MutT (NUDIX family)